jgi:hypothetical protein
MFHKLKQIKTNHVLSGSANETPLENLLQLSEFARFAYEQGELDNNLRHLNEGFIRAVHHRYGGHGLTNLIVLAMGHDQWEFSHFIDYLRVSLSLQASAPGIESVELDNHRLPANKSFHFYNTTYFQTTLARPLYAAGRHPGWLVYGVSGPRILVSHPFQGITGDVYNMYDNTSDIVAALTYRGYHGRFLFLDYMSGLDGEVNGIPRWALWFSIIAQHSDLVIFVRRFKGDFGPAQIIESQVIPDWVPKKIVQFLVTEFQNAKTPKLDPHMKREYCTEKGLVSKDEWDALQREHTQPHLDFWIRGSIPKDRFVHMQESGRVAEYPLNYELFR